MMAYGTMPEEPIGLPSLVIPSVSLKIPPFLSDYNPVPLPWAPREIERTLRVQADSLKIIHIHNLRTAFSVAWLLTAGRIKPRYNYKIVLTDHGSRFFPFHRTG